MKKIEASTIIAKANNKNKMSNPQSKVLKAMAVGIAMALATTSMPVTAFADDGTAEPTGNTEGGENQNQGVAQTQTTTAQDNLASDVSDGLDRADEALTTLDSATTAPTEGIPETVDSGKVSQAADIVIGAVDESVQDTVEKEVTATIPAADSGAGSTAESGNGAQDPGASSGVQQAADTTVDDKIADAETDYEAAKAEYEAANQVVVSTSAEVTQARTDYEESVAALVEAQAVVTTSEITSDVQATLDAVPTEPGTTLDVNKCELIDTTTDAFANTVTLYRNNLLTTMTEEEARAQIVAYLQAINAYNLSILNYQKSVTEFGQAAKEAADAEKDGTTNAGLEIAGTISSPEEVKAEIAEEKAIEAANTDLEKILKAAADSSSTLSDSLSKYFSTVTSTELDSEGGNWANGSGNGTVVLAETINTTLAAILGLDSAEAVTAKYYWQATQNKDGSYSFSLAIKGSNSTAEKLITCTGTSADPTGDKSVNLTGTKNRNDGKNDFLALNPEKTAAYDSSTWSGRYKDTATNDYTTAVTTLENGGSKAIAEILAEKLSGNNVFSEAIVKYFTGKNNNTTLDSNGTNWANGYSAGLKDSSGNKISINAYIASLLGDEIGGAAISGTDLNDGYIWTIVKTADGYSINVTSKDSSVLDATGHKTLVYSITLSKSGETVTSSSTVNEENLNNDNDKATGGNSFTGRLTYTYDQITTVNTIIASYQTKINQILTDNSNQIASAAAALLALQTNVNSLVNADEKTMSAKEYKEQVQDTIDAAKTYLNALKLAGTDGNLAQNSAPIRTDVTNPDNGGGTGTGGTGATTVTAEAAVVSDLITELETTLQTMDVAADGTTVEITDPAVALADLAQGTGNTNQDRQETGTQTVNTGNGEDLVTGDGADITNIADDGVALTASPKTDNTETDSAQLSKIEDEQTPLSAQTSAKKDLWWLILLILGGALEVSDQIGKRFGINSSRKK